MILEFFLLGKTGKLLTGVVKYVRLLTTGQVGQEESKNLGVFELFENEMRKNGLFEIDD
ncbi:MAG: hypothetical protein KAS07_03665 [Candidatus Pacebacteria bacterium]|nr:hypothetical protein [Candidatus Paceibacterota bacterium]